MSTAGDPKTTGYVTYTVTGSVRVADCNSTQLTTQIICHGLFSHTIIITRLVSVDRADLINGLTSCIYMHTFVHSHIQTKLIHIWLSTLNNSPRQVSVSLQSATLSYYY